MIKSVKLLILSALMLSGLATSAQWKIDETFDSEIPATWSGNLGDPGWIWQDDASGYSGVAVGKTGAGSTPQNLYSPKVRIDSGDSVFFNHYAIASAAENCQFYVKINEGSWQSFHQTNASVWEDQSFALEDIAGYSTGDSVQFRLEVSNESYDFLYVDYFRFGQALPANLPECANLLQPGNNQTETSLYPLLSWNQAANASEYKVCLGTNNPPDNLLDSVSISNDTVFSIQTALELNQTYYWQVVPSNALGDAPACEIRSFTTQSEFFPYLIDFENPTANLPGGWSVENGNSSSSMNDWHAAYNTEGFGNAGSYGFLSISLHIENPKDSYFISPALNLQSDKLYKISFWYNAAAQGAYEKLRVLYGSGPDIADQTTVIWDHPVLNRAGWKQGICYIQPETSGEHHISWHAYSDPAESSIRLDNLMIEELPDGPGAYIQPNPAIFPSTAIGNSTQAQIDVVNQGSATLESTAINYPEYFSGPDNFSCSDQTTIQIEYQPESTFTGFDTIYIETNGGDLIVPVEHAAGKTAFDCNYILDMHSNFEVIDNNGDGLTWEMNDFRPHEGDYSFQVQDDFTSTEYDDYLITPPLYVYENDNFSYWARTIDDLTFFATLEILVSPNAGTTTEDFTETLVPAGYLPGEWTAYNTDLSDYAGQVIRLAVHSNSTSEWTSRHFLDNIGMPYTSNPLECVNAIHPAADGVNVNNQSLTFSWDSTAYADGYLLSAGTDNPPTNLLFEMNTGNQTSYTIENLDPNTDYYWQITPAYGDFSAEACDVQHFVTGDFSGIDENRLDDCYLSKEGNNLILMNPSGKYIEGIEIIASDGTMLRQQNINSNDSAIKLKMPYHGIFLIRIYTKQGTELIKGVN
ncbi:MAG: choice-of-anchor J domain-containing protein [Bacteroidales bacterium]